MARPLRIEYPGAVYHITSRGNARDRIFINNTDRIFFLKLLSQINERYQWLCHAFCLMNNHYHLLVETIAPSLSQGMRQLNGVYTQSFNRRHQRVGHVFQGRYKAIIIQKDAHLLELCRYIVLNPIRAAMVKKPWDWKWSSFNATALNMEKPNCLTIDWILKQFSSDKYSAQKNYQSFVEKGMTDKATPWNQLKGQIFLGSDDFILSQTEASQTEERNIGEVPRCQRYVNRIKLKDLFVDMKDKSDRNKKIYLAHTTYGYRMKEIADYLSMHYTTISKIINRK